ncbi:MAG: amidase family protein [Actinomycetota bacterium]
MNIARTDFHAIGDELCDLPATEQVRMITGREVSARELLAAHLARIEALNPSLNAVVGTDFDVAEQKADAVDELVARGERPGPLAGLVTAHKDLVETADFVTSHGSPLFAGHRPKTDALLVSRMAAAGAVALGKTNTPEFGAGSHTFNPVYGTTRNPYDHSRTCGGSSGGAAVAVRTGMVTVADGSDFGGSLRNPAAWNNVVGFRSSPRVIPRTGVGNLWNPMPIDGPMARTVDDLALLFRVMAQPSLEDPLSHRLEIPPVISPATTGRDGRPMRVAWSATLGGLPVEPDVAAVLERFRDDLAILGWDVVEDEPDMSGTDEVFVTLRAFSFSRLAELGDGITSLKETVQDEIRRGLALSSAEITAAYAQLNVLWKRAIEFFTRYDLMIAPVTQVSPFPINQEYPTEVNGTAMGSYIEWMRSCCRITSFGVPAMSLPAGFTEAGLPVGAQLIGRPFGDIALLRAAKALEATSGHGSR